MKIIVGSRGSKLAVVQTNWLLDTQAFDLEEVGRQTLLNYVRGLGLD